MDTVPYMEKGFVFPVYNILLLPGVSTMIYYSQEPSGLKEALQQERPCLLLPIRRAIQRGYHQRGLLSLWCLIHQRTARRK
ncbi:MAG: hypothetical protein V8T10_07055 [Merdibacter sp.]